MQKAKNNFMGHIWQAFGQVMGWKGKDSAILWHYNTIRLKISIVWYLCLLEAMQTNDFSKKKLFRILWIVSEEVFSQNFARHWLTAHRNNLHCIKDLLCMLYSGLRFKFFFQLISYLTFQNWISNYKILLINYS